MPPQTAVFAPIVLGPLGLWFNVAADLLLLAGLAVSIVATNRVVSWRGRNPAIKPWVRESTRWSLILFKVGLANLALAASVARWISTVWLLIPTTVMMVPAVLVGVLGYRFMYQPGSLFQPADPADE